VHGTALWHWQQYELKYVACSLRPFTARNGRRRHRHVTAIDGRSVPCTAPNGHRRPLRAVNGRSENATLWSFCAHISRRWNGPSTVSAVIFDGLHRRRTMSRPAKQKPTSSVVKNVDWQCRPTQGCQCQCVGRECWPLYRALSSLAL